MRDWGSFWISEENDFFAWIVYFDNGGGDNWIAKSSKNYVRCVRVRQ